MRKLFAVYIFLVSWVISSEAQTDSSSSQKPNGPAKGSISGVLIDGASGQALPYVSVVTYFAGTETSASGSLTNETGVFAVQGLRPGSYDLELTSIGYQTKVIKSIKIEHGAWEVNSDTIKLYPSAEVLKEAVVQGSKSPVSNKLDKKVVEIKNINGVESMQTTDILQNVPSIDVDIDGQINLRGSGNVRVLIDGKPVPSTGDVGSILNSIPPSAIETIEVITNPSAKYDPDGVGGIINIVLRKERKDGYNINVTAGATTSPGGNIGINANFKKGRTNTFVNYGANYEERWRTGLALTEYKASDSRLLQDEYSVSDRLSHTLKIGSDVYLNKFNTLTFGVTGSYRTRGELEEVDYLNRVSSENDYFYRSGLEDQYRYSIDLNTRFKHDFGSPSKYIVFDATYNFNQRNETIDIRQDLLNSNFEFVEEETKQFTREFNDGSLTTLQFDFVNEREKDKLEFGAKSILRLQLNDFDLEDFDYSEGNFNLNTNLSNAMLYDEQVYGVYGIYGREHGKLSWQVGMRGEYASIVSELVEAEDSVFRNPYFSWFPSFHSSYKLNNQQSVRLNYSRRINRPSDRQLNPFTEYTDPYRLRRGNPFLQPEYVNSFELGYTKIFKTSSLNGELYYRHTTDAINRYITVSDSNVTTSTYTNFGSEIASGLELSYTARFKNRAFVNLSGNVYRRQISGDIENTQLNNEAINWSLRGNATYLISSTLSGQVFGFYSGPRNIAQGEILPIYSIDVALRKSFAKDKGSLSLRVSDIFNTREFNLNTNSETFAQEMRFKRQSRILSATFTWNFGNIKQDKKSGRSRPDSDDDDD